MTTTHAMARVITTMAATHGVDLGAVEAHVRIMSPPYMPLSIEVIGPHLVAVAHYGEQNGDLMADPDMVFYTNTTDGSWVPVSYQNDYVGVYRCAAEVQDSHLVVLDPREQEDQAAFADLWAANLEAQGFLALRPERR